MHPLKFAALVLVLLALVAIPTVIIIRFAKTHPAVYARKKLSGPGERLLYGSGFGGLLDFLVAGQVAWFLRALWDVSHMAGDFYFVLSREPQMTLPALVALLPVLLSLALSAVMLWILAVRRNPNALAVAVVCLWLMGPAVAMLESWYFQAELTEASILQLFGWALFWSLYLVVSPRCAMTYGTRRGARIAGGKD